jgi:hypothetical protein
VLRILWYLCGLSGEKKAPFTYVFTLFPHVFELFSQLFLVLP